MSRTLLPSVPPVIRLRVFVAPSAMDPGFQEFVWKTLRDPSGWEPWGVDFVRVDKPCVYGEEEPGTNFELTPESGMRRFCDARADLCGMNVNEGMLSHRTGNRHVPIFSTTYVHGGRWLGGPDFKPPSLEEYRKYVIQHEVGHALGIAAHSDPVRTRAFREWEGDPAEGEYEASVMMQQTKTVPRGFRFSSTVGAYDASRLFALRLGWESLWVLQGM